VLLLYTTKSISIFIRDRALKARWASLSAGDDPKKIETYGVGPPSDPVGCPIGQRRPLCGWAPIGPCGPPYRLATTTEKKLKPLFISARGTPHPYGLAVGYVVEYGGGPPSDPVGWPIGQRRPRRKKLKCFFIAFGHTLGLGTHGTRYGVGPAYPASDETREFFMGGGGCPTEIISIF